MRRYLSLLLAVGLVVGALAAPAVAGAKKKHVHDSFEAEALPFPNVSGVSGTEQRGCFAGIEGLHKVSHEFQSPGRGTLTATLEGFTGDWDLAMFAEDGSLLSGSLNDQTSGEPPKEQVAAPLTKKQKVVLVACNWLGEPGPVEVHYSGVFRV